MKRSFNQMANAYVKELRKNKIDQAVIHMFGKEENLADRIKGGSTMGRFTEFMKDRMMNMSGESMGYVVRDRRRRH